MTMMKLERNRLRNGLGTSALNRPTLHSLMNTFKYLSLCFSATQWGLMYAINGNTTEHIIYTASEHRPAQNKDGSQYH